MQHPKSNSDEHYHHDLFGLIFTRTILLIEKSRSETTSADRPNDENRIKSAEFTYNGAYNQ